MPGIRERRKEGINKQSDILCHYWEHQGIYLDLNGFNHTFFICSVFKVCVGGGGEWKPLCCKTRELLTKTMGLYNNIQCAAMHKYFLHL